MTDPVFYDTVQGETTRISVYSVRYDIYGRDIVPYRMVNIVQGENSVDLELRQLVDAIELLEGKDK